MREALLDHVAARFGGGVEQQASDATVDVEKHQAADLLVRSPKTARQLDEHGPGDGRRLVHASAEVFATENEEACVVHRDHVRRARLPVDQRELAEVGADAENGEDHLTSIVADEHHLHAPLAHHEERVARVILEQDDAAARIGALARQLGEARELGLVEPAQEGDGAQEVRDLHDVAAAWLGENWRGNLDRAGARVKRPSPCQLVSYRSPGVYFSATPKVLRARHQ